MANVTKKVMAGVLALSLVCGTIVTSEASNAASIKLNKTKLTMKAGDSFKLKLKVKGKFKGSVKWKSSKKSVAKVSSKGVVKAISKGKAKITVKAAKKTL